MTSRGVFAAVVALAMAAGAAFGIAPAEAARSEGPAALAARAQERSERVVVPAAVVDAAFAPGEWPSPAVMTFLRGRQFGGQTDSPEDVTARTLALIKAMKESPAGAADPARLRAALTKVARGASAALSVSPIMRVNIDRDYEPQAGSYGFDFGPDGAPVARGFTPGLVSAGYLTGALQPIQTPGGDPLMSDGIRGARTASMTVPVMRWRVILLTDAGGAGPMTTPFGYEIVANGVRFHVGESSPIDWTRQAVLTNRGIEIGALSLASVNTAQSNGRFAPGVTGGLLWFEVDVTTGRLLIEFMAPPGRSDPLTYLTAMIVEPAEGPSSVRELLDARLWGLGLVDRLSLEALIAAAIADGLGRPRPPSLDLPPGRQVQTAPTNVVSPFGPVPAFGSIGAVFGGSPGSTAQ